MKGEGGDNRRTLKLVGGLALGLGLLAWFLAGIHWAELFDALGRVKWRYLAASGAVFLVYFWLYGLRWGVLLKNVDPHVPKSLLWRANTILWGFNTLLPLRAGNVLRPAVVALERPVTFTTLLFTTVGEFVCEAFGFVAVVIVMSAIIPEEYANSGVLSDVEQYGVASGATMAVLFAIILLLSTRRARSLVEGWTDNLPSRRVQKRVLALFDQLVAGMATIGRPTILAQALGVTLLLWVAWTAGIALTLMAFDLDLPLAAPMFLGATITAAMSVPQAPGFLGVFHVVTEESLVVWGAGTGESEAVALLLWMLVFVPITAISVVHAWRDGIALSGGTDQMFAKLMSDGSPPPEEEDP